MTNDQIMVGMASIPERVGSLKRAVASLAPQADRIVVALNEYDEVPGFLAQYPHVEPVLTGDRNGGDAEKFAGVDDWDGIVATCDDDILYPPDYIASLVAGIERYGARTAVGHHGGKTLGWNGSAVAASHKRVRCLHEQLADDVDVNVLGTGAMAYHAGHVPVWRGAFRHANMADVQMAIHGRTMGVPFVGLQHPGGWLKDICPPPDAGRRIYDSNRKRDGSACDTAELREVEIRRFDWTAAPPRRPTVRVSVATCARPAKLVELLGDLEREARWVDVGLTVYEDPSSASYDEAHRICARMGWEWRRFSHHLGREGHWQLVHRELRDAKRSSAEWYLFLPDDVRLVRHAIPKAITTWYRLDDPATLTLWRLRSLEGLSNWTGKKPVQRADATEIFHVDGLYLCRREALDAVGFHCSNPVVLPPTGSGVGRALSRALDRAGKRMYRVDSSLATANDDGVSVMNPDERLLNPTVTL